MSRSDLQVVFGAGQVGLALANHLATSGVPVRSVSRHRPATLSQGVEWHQTDASDPAAAKDVAKGASVIGRWQVWQCFWRIGSTFS